MDVAQIRALKPRLDNYLTRFADCFSRCDTREHLAVYVTGQLSHLFLATAHQELRGKKPGADGVPSAYRNLRGGAVLVA